jgi:hypothetical protein
VTLCFSGKKNHDKDAPQKAFTNLDIMGSVAASGNCCCMDIDTRESDTGFIAATRLRNIGCSNKNNRLVKI